MVKGNLKVKAFHLFDKGKDASSPEVKALGLKPSTRYSYYSNWNKGRGGEPEKRKKVNLLGGESLGAYTPLISETGVEAEPEPGPEPEEQNEPKGGKEVGVNVVAETPPILPLSVGGDHERPSIPEKVVGAGLPVTVDLALKTLSFYEIARTIDPKLTLGDFLDDCVQDFFWGRGKDLGLLEIGGK